ncbi:MAG TPA: OmpA family protein [Steroidobacteraceae bacterium]|nr:OmpA family protein [Steroidobacteraceae bacterium]
MKTSKNLIAAAVGSILIAACASAPKSLPEVEQARADVQTLSQDPMAEQAASKELSDARTSLQGAETALKEGRKNDAIHYAYLASQQAQTGEARIDEQRAKAQIAKGEAERNKVLLEARTKEAQQAAAAAKSQAAEAQAARQQAEDMQRQLTDLQAKQTDRGMVLTLGDVLFDTNSATLKPGAANEMQRIADFMQKNPDTKVIIEGYTDSRGSEDYNQQLSQRRAQAVQDALASRGIDRSRVEAVGRGESMPVASNDTSAGRQQNRRVEVVFSDQEGRFASGANAAYR